MFRRGTTSNCYRRGHEEIKIALIGCGTISYKHVEAAVNNRESAELVAVCDVIEEKQSKSGAISSKY